MTQPDVFAPSAEDKYSQLRLPVETRCFKIDEIDWRGAESFPWLPAQTPVAGACIGSRGLQVLRDWIAHALIARGYITSQVSIPNQDLASGRLIVEILPGRVGAIRDEAGRIGWTSPVFPAGTGALMNVRDLDQALENIRRLPGQAATAFDIVPGSSLGESDIVIRHPDSARRFRFVMTADNSGLDATGRNQLGAIVAIDSPLHLYDQLIATFNNDANLDNHTLGSRSKSVAWNVPIGYASFSIGYSEWSNRQTLPDIGAEFPWEGRTRRYEAGLSYVPYRSSRGKGLLKFKLVRREDHTWFAGQEVGVHKHDITSYEMGFSHREKWSDIVLDAGVGLRASLAGLSSFPGVVYGQSNWNGRYRIVTATASVDAPIRFGTRRFGYRGTFFLQHSPVAIPPTEYLQIGGRYTVRGFDGNSTVAAASGWMWRNELAAPVVASNEAYVALDAGQVSGGAPLKDGRMLIGAALGIRGGYKWLGYDVALGMPLRKPASLHTATPTLDLSLTARF